MGQHGAHVREVEPLLALAVGKLDLVLRQVRARLDGQAGKPGREGRFVTAVEQDRHKVDVDTEGHRCAEAKGQHEPTECRVAEGRTKRDVCAWNGVTVGMRGSCSIGMQAQVLGPAPEQ